jgi:hypothetical protein
MVRAFSHLLMFLFEEKKIKKKNHFCYLRRSDAPSDNPGIAVGSSLGVRLWFRSCSSISVSSTVLSQLYMRTVRSVQPSFS